MVWTEIVRELCFFQLANTIIADVKWNGNKKVNKKYKNGLNLCPFIQFCFHGNAILSKKALYNYSTPFMPSTPE